MNTSVRNKSFERFFGNFFIRAADLLAIPSPDSSKGYSVQLEIDSLNNGQKVYLQNVVLYTTNNSERRIRVSTLELHASSSINDIFNSMNSEAIVTLLAKIAIEDLALKSLTDSREALFKKLVSIIYSYLSAIGMAKNASITLPPCLQTLPLFTLALLKSPAFADIDTLSIDERTFSQSFIRMIPQIALISYIHPLMYNLTDMKNFLNTKIELPDPENVDDVLDPNDNDSADSIPLNGKIILQ